MFKRKKSSSFYYYITMALVIVIFIIYTAWNNDKEENNKAIANSVVEVLDSALKRNSAMALFASRYINSECTPETVRQLSHYAALNGTLHSVNIVKDNKWRCSSLEGSHPVDIELKNDNNQFHIDQVTKDGIELYLVFYPFKNGSVVVSVYKSSLDRLLQAFAMEMKINIDASLTPLSGSHTLASAEYPFWIKIDSNKRFSSFLRDEYIPLIITLLCYIAALVIYAQYRRHSPVLAIKLAIKNGEMEPYYQPIVDIQTGCIVGAEQLVRWLPHNHDIIYPNEFIPIAEKYKIVSNLTIALMHKAVDDLKEIRIKTRHSFYITINASPTSLEENVFINKCISFGKKVKQLGVQPCIEITEREKNNIPADVIDLLIANDIRIILDDFGTGNSNYESISRMKPACLKIDKIFIDSIGTKSINESILSHIVQFSQEVEIPNVAEGIENITQHNVLKAMGVQYGQGYLYGKPVPLDEFIAQLQGPGMEL
ncbi:cyclic diguanylate phosphodiesterase [Enterobacter sp. Cy-643]|uniref:EAL domain-containing protein n=1 Tax=Enterobacter sp. Cy-643 TaxID=2608346 RepID=UPI001422DC53|nr:EAL domain-containing protein [Enterobacter sp. Cy-643]NIF32995.1 cyclic diguanylate phosphodiesterase [Enterobacter sp. Cy-643]